MVMVMVETKDGDDGRSDGGRMTDRDTGGKGWLCEQGGGGEWIGRRREIRTRVNGNGNGGEISKLGEEDHIPGVRPT